MRIEKIIVRSDTKEQKELEIIVNDCCKYFSITEKQILSTYRGKEVSECRAFICFLAREKNIRVKFIERVLNVNNASVSVAHSKIKNYIKMNDKLIIKDVKVLTIFLNNKNKSVIPKSKNVKKGVLHIYLKKPLFLDLKNGNCSKILLPYDQYRKRQLKDFWNSKNYFYVKFSIQKEWGSDPIIFKIKSIKLKETKKGKFCEINLGREIKRPFEASRIYKKA